MAYHLVEVTSMPDRLVREAGDLGMFAALVNRASLARIHSVKGKLTEDDKGVLSRLAALLRSAAEPAPAIIHGDGWGMAFSAGLDSLVADASPGADTSQVADVADAADAIVASSATDEQVGLLQEWLARLSAASKAVADDAECTPGPLELAWSAT